MNAPVQGAVRAEWYGNPFAFAQGDKILAGDEFLGEELISCLPQLLALLFLGLSTLLSFRCFRTSASCCKRSSRSSL